LRQPKNYGLKTNTVSHFPKLIKLLIKRLQKGEIQQVGIIADADYVSGGGFQQRWHTLTTQLAQNWISYFCKSTQVTLHRKSIST